MFGAILKATNSSFRKGMAFCRSIYVKIVMKLLPFRFEQTSFIVEIRCRGSTVDELSKLTYVEDCGLSRLVFTKCLSE